MDFSRLNKRIKFIATDEGKTDKDGYPLESKIVIRKCWASVRGLRGKEFYNAATIQNEKDKIFNCRYFKGLTESMKIKYNDNLYDITSINDLKEQHIEYEIHAKVVSLSG